MTVDGYRNVNAQMSMSQNNVKSAIQTPQVSHKNVAVEASKVVKNKAQIHEMAQEQKAKTVDETKLIDAIEKANKSIDMYNRKLEFSIHDKTKEIMVKVIDTETDEIIKEIPSEKILDMVARLWDLAGIMIDEKA